MQTGILWVRDWCRLLARVLKQGDTSTVKGGGGGGRFEKTFLWKPLKFTLLHVSICSKLVRNFSNTLGFVSLCRHASLLTTTFSFSQVHLQTDQNVKCMIIMRIEAISFQIYNILSEIIENNFPFSPEFGRPKASIFCSRGVPGCPSG
jgi:hypothetical protein